MTTQDIFQLISTLSSDDRKLMKDILVTYAAGKKSTTVILFDLLVKAKTWKEGLESDLKRKLKLDANKYYRVRSQLGIRLLRASPRLVTDGEWNLTEMFRNAIRHNIMSDLTKELVESIKEQVKNENWMLAGELQELAEDYTRRHGADEHLEKLADFSTTLEYADRYRQEQWLRDGLRRVRKGLKTKGPQKKFILSGIKNDYQDVKPLSEKSKYHWNSLQIGKLLLSEQHNEAADLASGLVKEMLINQKSQRMGFIIDELSYLIPLLLGLGRRKEATEFIFLLPSIQINSRADEVKLRVLEAKNLVVLACEGWDIILAEKALQCVHSNISILTEKLLPILLYGIALVFFVNGDPRKCNEIINTTKNLSISKRNRIDLELEALSLLTFFIREDADMVEYQSRMVRRHLRSKQSPTWEFVLDIINQLIGEDRTSRKTLIESLPLTEIESQLISEDRIGSYFFSPVPFVLAYKEGKTLKEYYLQLEEKLSANSFASLLQG